MILWAWSLLATNRHSGYLSRETFESDNVFGRQIAGGTQ